MPLNSQLTYLPSEINKLCSCQALDQHDLGLQFQVILAIGAAREGKGIHDVSLCSILVEAIGTHGSFILRVMTHIFSA